MNTPATLASKPFRGVIVSLVKKQTVEERRLEILAATCQVVIERGFAATRISDVAKQLNVSNSLIHYHFDSKESLLAAAFEYYARHDNEGDYEVIQTVAPEEFAAIANKFGLDPTSEILAIVQQISDAGRGEELVAALNSKEIKCEIFTWSS